MIPGPKAEKITLELQAGVADIAEWYVTGATWPACQENFNRDLAWLIQKLEERHGVKFHQKLRAYKIESDGNVVVRFEDEGLS